MYRLIKVQAVNRPGVLHRMTQTVLRNHYNIDHLTVTETADPKISLMTFGICFSEEAVEHEASLLAKQMEKQVDVVKAEVLTANAAV